MKRSLVTTLLLLGSAFIISCNSQPLMDYGRLVDGLRKGGATVKAEGINELIFQFPATGHPIFSVDAKKIKVNGDNITVLEYADEVAAEIETRRVVPDGYTFVIPFTIEKGEGEGGHINWEAPPHFYQAGKIIVFYAGENQTLIALLNDLLGIQFAGVGLTRSGEIYPEHIH